MEFIEKPRTSRWKIISKIIIGEHSRRSYADCGYYEPQHADPECFLHRTMRPCNVCSALSCSDSSWYADPARSHCQSENQMCSSIESRPSPAVRLILDHPVQSSPACRSERFFTLNSVLCSYFKQDQTQKIFSSEHQP